MRKRRMFGGDDDGEEYGDAKMSLGFQLTWTNAVVLIDKSTRKKAKGPLEEVVR